MFRFLVVISAILSVIAFRIPTSRMQKASSTLSMSDKWVGASVEVGGEVYDPFDMLKLHSVAPTVFPHPKWLRESELKHCRIAMLASVGAFTGQYGLVIPGYTADPDPVTNLNNFFVQWPFGFAQIFASLALIEGVSNPTEFWFGKGDREAGNLGYDPLGFFKGSDAKKDDLRLKELKNGRLAMMAMAAYTSEHWIPGSVPFLPGKF